MASYIVIRQYFAEKTMHFMKIPCILFVGFNNGWEVIINLTINVVV